MNEGFDDRCMTCLSILGAKFCTLIRTNTDSFDQSLKKPHIAVGALRTYPPYAEPLCKIHLEASKNAYKQRSFVFEILSMSECKQLWSKQKFWFK